MMRFIMPIVLIGISITVFFTFTDPIYKDVGTLKTEVTSYNDALNNSTMFENERDKLTLKYGTIDPNNLVKLQKFLPDSIDNIRLILEIEQIASPFNMVLTDVRYNATDRTAVAAPVVTATQGGATAQSTTKSYGAFDLEFSVTSSYSNFIAFLKKLESNLRIVDISSIDFSSDTSTSANSSKITSSEVYKYNFKITTYWLKK